MSTPPRRLGLSSLRVGAFRPGWLAVAAVLVLAAVALVSFQIGPRIPGPGGDPSPSPVLAQVTREFIVLPPTQALPDKAQTDLAGSVLAARLNALGFGTFTSASGFGIQFELPRTGANDATIREVLAATGDVSFVPLPPDQYGTVMSSGPLEAREGLPLPTDEPALFGWEGVDSIEPVTDEQGRRVLQIDLKEASAQAFGVYTAAHVNEFFAILIDGTVVAAPSVNEPIEGEQLQLVLSQLNGGPDATIAILAGGMLPEAWAAPLVPEVIGRGEIIDRLITELEASNSIVGQAVATSAQLDAMESGGQWIPVWTVIIEGQFTGCIVPAPRAGTETCPLITFQEFVVNAETGDRIVEIVD